MSALEVVEASLARVETHNGTVNAVVTLNPRALDDARAIDKRIARGDDPGLLAGLPVGIKDVTPVASLRTTYGSPMAATPSTRCSAGRETPGTLTGRLAGQRAAVRRRS